MGSKKDIVSCISRFAHEHALDCTIQEKQFQTKDMQMRSATLAVMQMRLAGRAWS